MTTDNNLPHSLAPYQLRGTSLVPPNIPIRKQDRDILVFPATRMESIGISLLLEGGLQVLATNAIDARKAI